MSLVQAIERPARRLGDAKAVGRVLDLSWRTVYRLADAGKIPPGYKLGALRRWDMAEIESFIAGGCKPPCRDRSPASVGSPQFTDCQGNRPRDIVGGGSSGKAGCGTPLAALTAWCLTRGVLTNLGDCRPTGPVRRHHGRE